MAWCEANERGYVFGLAKNNRLNNEIAGELARAKEESEKTGKGSRVYQDFCYQTLKSWSQSRRVVDKDWCPDSGYGTECMGIAE